MWRSLVKNQGNRTYQSLVHAHIHRKREMLIQGREKLEKDSLVGNLTEVLNDPRSSFLWGKESLPSSAESIFSRV